MPTPNIIAPWKKHLNTYINTHPNMSLGNAMKEASKTYKSTTKTKRKKAVINRHNSYKYEVNQKIGISLSEANKLFNQYYTYKLSDDEKMGLIDEVDINSDEKIDTVERKQIQVTPGRRSSRPGDQVRW